MQIHSLRIKSYKSWRIDDSPSDEIARLRLKKVKHFWQLRAEGCSEALALEVIETARSTLYRWQQAYRRYGVAGLSHQSRAPKV